MILLSNKARYINDNLSGKIDLRRKKKDEIVKILKGFTYDALGENSDKITNGDISITNYHYLVKMPMDSVTEEAVEKLMKEKGEKETELSSLIKLNIKDIWLNELDKLKCEYIQFCNLENTWNINNYA